MCRGQKKMSLLFLLPSICITFADIKERFYGKRQETGNCRCGGNL